MAWVRPSLKVLAGILLVGVTAVIVALIMPERDSDRSEAPGGGKFIGVRHDASSMSLRADTQAGQEPSSDTVVRDGITVVSPSLLVPVIDIDAIQIANGSDDSVSATKGWNGRKRSRYARRSYTRANNHWKAFGLAVR
jgi:hypothetical protein